MTEKRAWVENGVVIEVLSSSEGIPFEECYPIAVVAACIPCGNDVEEGWIYDGMGFFPSRRSRDTSKEELIREEICKRLDEIDKRSVRAQRAILTGAASGSDHDELVSFETEASLLRKRLKMMDDREE